MEDFSTGAGIAPKHLGGHRAKALDLTDKAIKQVQDGIAFANKHDKK